MLFIGTDHLEHVFFLDIAQQVIGLNEMVTGVQVAVVLDGQSLLSLMTSGNDEAFDQRAIYQYYPFYDLRWGLTPSASIRVGDYKLIWDWHGTVELYNIPVDPFEQNDLAKSHPDRTERLLGELKAWLRNNVKAQYFPRLNPAYDADLDQRGPMVNLWADHP